MSAEEYKPTCPAIFFEQEVGPDRKQIYTIYCQKLDVQVECYVNTAIVTMKGEWVNRTNDTLNCVFATPTDGPTERNIMNVTLNIGADDNDIWRVLTTAILSKDDAEKIIKENQNDNKNDKKKTEEKENDSNLQSTPGVFRLPFDNVSPGDTIKLTCQYIEELGYYKKGYIVSLPLYFPPGTIIESASWDEVVSVECKINALIADTKVNNNSFYICSIYSVHILCLLYMMIRLIVGRII